jgi:hypothetical protein
MPTPTYTLIDSVTLASSAGSVGFTNIDQSFGDLVLVGNGTFNDNAIVVFSYGSGFSGVRAFGTGSATTSDEMPNNNRLWTPVSTSRPTFNFSLQIMDYSATDKHKSALCRASNDTSVGMAAFRSATNSAITAIYILENTVVQQFQPGSTFFLYGIAKAL